MKQQEIIVKPTPNFMKKDLEDTQEMCKALLATTHYRKLGAEGIFAIVEKAKSVGVGAMDALNGGMYFVQGKVEMTSAMMNQLIRSAGHSVTKDRKSDSTICILHGKRADNSDTWVESFSIADAKIAGIYKNQWLKWPKDMLFARALSRLARQLFPDVIKGCYIQGEISEAPAFDAPVEAYIEPVSESTDNSTPDAEIITKEQARHLDEMIGEDIPYRKCVMEFLQKQLGVDTLEKMPISLHNKILPVATNKFEERTERLVSFDEQAQAEEEEKCT